MPIEIGKRDGARDSVSRPENGDQFDILRQMIASRIDPEYCESSQREALIRDAQALGLSRTDTEVAVDLELESLFTANEYALLARLEANLRQFTDKDKKLDPKERRDAIQLACRPAVGYRQGLRYDVAERFLVQFCRSNGVKVKKGFMRWATP
jgi:hypothetical protein